MGKTMAPSANKWDVTDLPADVEYAAQQRFFDRHAWRRCTGWRDLLLCSTASACNRDHRGAFCSEVAPRFPGLRVSIACVSLDALP